MIFLPGLHVVVVLSHLIAFVWLYCLTFLWRIAGRGE